MKRLNWISGFTLAALFFGIANPAIASPTLTTLTFGAHLEGSQEVPPVDTVAFGLATLTLDAAQTRLEMSISVTGIYLDDSFRVHIHRAPAGVNGPVVFGLISPNSDLNGDLTIAELAGPVVIINSAWDLGEGAVTDLASELPYLLNDGLYLNVHTANFPAGEIRGQIIRQTAPIPAPSALALVLTGVTSLWRLRRRVRY